MTDTVQCPDQGVHTPHGVTAKHGAYWCPGRTEPLGVRPIQSYWEPGPESYSEDDRELAEAQELAIDMSVTGSAWLDGDGKRVAPEDVTVLHVDVAKDGTIGVASASQDADGNTVVQDETHVFSREQLARFSAQMGSYTNALSRSTVAGKGFLSPAIAAAAPGIGNAIHAAMEAEAAKGVHGDRVVIDEAIELALAPGALPEPFGSLNLTEWTAAMLADWQDATITSAELLTLLDEMLDRTVHSSACHIDPDDTTCFCVIGQLRSVLPPCPVKQPPPSGEGDLWHCTRKAHPASPDRHVWSNR